MQTTLTISRSTGWWLNWLPMYLTVNDGERVTLNHSDLTRIELPRQVQYAHIKLETLFIVKKNVSLKLRPEAAIDFKIVSSALATVLSLLIPAFFGLLLYSYTVPKMHPPMRLAFLAVIGFFAWPNIVQVEYDPNDVLSNTNARV